MEELLPIGEFSAQTGLSAKMLRSYAAEGLLVPAAVDRATGYRYYTSSQVERAQVIGVLRRAGVSLAEIAGVLDRPDAAALDRLERRLEAETAVRRDALAEARRRLTAGLQTPSIDQMPIQRRGDDKVFTITTGGATAIGPVRRSNQDALAATPTLAAVGDGFGLAGEQASAEAMTALCQAFVADPTLAGLGAGFQAANRAVVTLAQQQQSGTTLAAVGVVEAGGKAHLVAGNVGDSRVYLLHDGTLSQVTDDHTLVADLVRRGDLSRSAAAEHPERHILTRALGMGPEVAADTYEVHVDAGDRLLLCTDGLIHELDEQDIADVLGSPRVPEDAARELVRLGVDHGGADNITAVVVHVSAV
jgi:serine/threonine protein phosphatase PrpC